MNSLLRSLPNLRIGDRVARWINENLSNPRSRLSLLGLAFTIAAGGLSLLDSFDSQIKLQIAQRREQLASIEHVGDAMVWHGRRTATDLARIQAETRLWEAETEGLAEANLQTWIIEQAAQAGLGQIEVHTSINRNATNPLKLRQLTAQISGRFVAAPMFKLLEAVASQKQLIVVNRLDVHTLPAPHFEIWLVTYLRPAPAA